MAISMGSGDSTADYIHLFARSSVVNSVKVHQIRGEIF